MPTKSRISAENCEETRCAACEDELDRKWPTRCVCQDAPKPARGGLLSSVLQRFRTVVLASAWAAIATVRLDECCCLVVFPNAPLGPDVPGENRPDEFKHVLDALLRFFQL